MAAKKSRFTARPRFKSKPKQSVGVTTGVRRRIRFKSKPTYKLGRKKGSKKEGPSARDHAIMSGLVPKARNAYALFTMDEMRKSEYVGKSWQAHSKQIARAWKELGPEQKATYRDRASEERKIQHEAMCEHGLRRAPKVGDETQVCKTRPGKPLVNPEQARFGEYVLLQQDEIGRGTYGQVLSAKEKRTERRVAVKVFEDVDEARREISMYEHLWTIGGHRCILPLLKHFAEPPTPYMSMPFSPGANLRKVLQAENLAMEIQKGIVAQLAEAMTWLHSCKVAHLDLKPGNLLWEFACCHLIVVDFGMSLKLKEDGKPANDITPFNGVTANYRPPELWNKQVSNDTMCWPVDVWSFGVTVVEIYSRKVLFPGDREQQVQAGVRNWTYYWASKAGHAQLVKVPLHVRSVVWFCCSPEPTVRPRMQEDVTAWGLQLAPCPMRC